MLEFWIAAAAMLLLGYVFFIPALSGRVRREPLSRAKLNLALHQQRQRELAHEAAGSEAMKELTSESERNLLYDLEAATKRPAKPAASGRAALAAALAILPIFALIAYLALGRPDLLGQPAAPTMADVEESIQRLAERLRAKPDDLEGWVLLGRSLQETRRPEQAVTAYQFALKLAPDNLDLKGLYAEALAEANHGTIAGKPAEIIEEILRKDPNHKAGLWLAGAAAAERKDTKKAVEYWGKLKAQFPPESEESRQIGRYIAAAGGAADGPEATATVPGKRIRVKVALADKLKAQAAPEDALFIFARAAEGPPMPLAVVRKQVRDLPVEVVLDDSMAMMPELKLSTFERIVIGARVSKSGRPTPSPGDLQGLSGPLAPRQNEGPYEVIVDQRVGEGG